MLPPYPGVSKTESGRRQYLTGILFFASVSLSSLSLVQLRNEPTCSRSCQCEGNDVVHGRP
jgi:hypothetical protein